MRAFLAYFRDLSLEVMSCGASMQALLAEFALALQAEIPNAVVGVTVLDNPGNTFRHAIFPSMPASFSENLVGNPISYNRGSCGRAVLTGRPVEVPEVATDERFSAHWKALFAAHGLTSMVSIPAVSSDGQVHGSLAVIHPMGSPPTVEERAFLAGAAKLCATLCRYSRTQESHTLLVGELEHRMRNLFSTLSGVAVLTLRSHADPAEFRRVLDQRMVMMQRAHALALAPGEMALAALIEEVLAAYREGFVIVCSGPAILLAGEAAAALAMVIHELCTNAAKYGALSQPGGELDICWSTGADEQNDGVETFNLTWQERHGPSVSPPLRKGYGTLMVNGALRNAFNGSAAFTYDPDGFSCRISAPVSERLGRLDIHL